MRRMMIAGNWKLNKTIGEATAFADVLAKRLVSHDLRDVVIAPPYTALAAVSQSLSGTHIAVSAQDVFYETEGAFTGAISAAMIKDAGCTYTLVGHSERRLYFAETVETTVKRLVAAKAVGLIPIFCVGETLQERESGRMHDVLRSQLSALATLDFSANAVVVAYEPVWAIGTGVVASESQAQEAHAFVRGILAPMGLSETRILYGGSVKPSNAAGLLAQSDIDGLLVGGASLNITDFLKIIAAGQPGSYEDWFDLQFP